MKDFNVKLKKVRQNKGLSQTELADIMSVKQQRISEYERGVVTPSLERLVEIAQILDVSLDELVEFKRIQNKLSKDLINKTK